MLSRRPEIALLIETSTSWGEGVIEGIIQYAREHGPWFFHLEPHGRYEEPRLPKGWRGEGVIARVLSERQADDLVGAGIPTVNVSSVDVGMRRFPTCTCDDESMGTVAAEHLLLKGFRHFAYYPPQRRPGYTDLLQRAFEHTVRHAGFECVAYRGRLASRVSKNWLSDREKLESWLNQLPKPVGLLAWNATGGRRVTEACRYAAIMVPGEVAVLAGEYDRLACRISTPPLSAIDFPTQQLGYDAASLLAKIMERKAFSKTPQLVKAHGILAAPSTDITAIDDPTLALALCFIRQHATEGITIADVVRQIPMTRRMFERRFHDVFGHGPATEIRAIRIHHAKSLLRETTLPVSSIARNCGYSTGESFARAFLRQAGVAPLEYRKRRGQGPGKSEEAER